jgi:hypothetical protein
VAENPENPFDGFTLQAGAVLPAKLVEIPDDLPVLLVNHLNAGGHVFIIPTNEIQPAVIRWRRLNQRLFNQLYFINRIIHTDGNLHYDNPLIRLSTKTGGKTARNALASGVSRALEGWRMSGPVFCRQPFSHQGHPASNQPRRILPGAGGGWRRTTPASLKLLHLFNDEHSIGWRSGTTSRPS